MKKNILLLFLLFSICPTSQAQWLKNDTLPKRLWSFREEFPHQINKKRLRTVIGTEAAAYGVGLAYMSLIWYKDAKWQPLQFFNDNTEWEQVDKLGHTYTSYQLSERGYYALRWAGVPKGKALLYGGTMSLMALAPVEFLDGFTDEFGFSVPDMVANTAGTVLFIGQEALFNEQIIKMKWSYHFSEYAPLIPNQLGKSLSSRIFKDYNGHTYWFSVNLYSALGKNVKIPKWLCLSVGYGADGMMAKFANPYPLYQDKPFPYFDRYQQYYLSVDIDLNKIPTRSRLLKKLFQQLNLLKIPAPTLEWNQIQGLKFRPIYF